MSQTIDDRVVSLQFDNKQFEKGVGESLNTLEKLKESLDLKDAGKNLSKISQEANKIDLSHLSDSIDQLNDRFSTLGIVGITALSNIVTGAMNLAKKLGSILASPIKIAATGGWSRALNIEEAKFQLKGLGVAWEDVYDDIDYAVSGTAYGLDSAAKAASQLTASGIQLGDSMKKALRGISGVAAMTNSEYDEISRVFTRVAGQGRVMATDLNSLAARGLNAAATLGQALGKTESEIRQMVTRGQIDFETFANAMDNAFGEHAKDANNTFTGALGNMKFALKKIGAEFATPIMTNSVKVFNSTRLMINALKDNMGTLFEIFRVLTEGITGKLSKSIDKVTDFLKNRFTGAEHLNRALAIMVNSLVSIGKVINSAFKQVFNGSMGDHINNLAKGIERIAEYMAPTKKSLNGLHDVLVVVFTIIKKIGQAIGFIVKNVGRPIFVILRNAVTWMLSLISVIGDLISAITKIIGESKAFQFIMGGIEKVTSRVSGFFKDLAGIITGTSDTLSESGKKIQNVLLVIRNSILMLLALPILGIVSAFNKLKSLDLSKTSRALTNIKNIMVELVKEIRSSKAVTTIINGLSIAFTYLVSVLATLGLKFKEFFNKLADGQITLDVIKGKIKKTFITMQTAIKNFTFDKIVNGLKEFIKSARELGFLEAIKTRISNVGGIIGKVLNALVDRIKLLVDDIKKSGSVFEYLIDKISTFVKKLTGLNSELSASAGAKIKTNGLVTFMDLLKEKFSGFKETISKGLAKLREEGLLTKTLMVAFIFGIIKALFQFSSNSKKITKAMTEGTGMFKAFSGFGKFMEGLLNPLKALESFIKGLNETYIKAHQKSPAENFAIIMKSLAIGIGAIASSIAVLYLVVGDINKLKDITSILGIFLASMTVAAGIVTAISMTVKDTDTSFISVFSKNIISMTLALIGLSSIVTKFSKIPWPDLFKGLSALTGIAVIFISVQAILSKMDKTGAKITEKVKSLLSSAVKMVTFVGSFMLIAIALMTMAAAFKKIIDLHLLNPDNLEELVFSITLMAGLFAAVIYASKWLSPATKSLLQLAGAFALLGVATNALARACKLMKKVEYNEIGKMLVAYSAVALLFLGIAKNMNSSGITKSVIALGLTFTLLANAVLKLTLVSMLMKHVDWLGLLKTMSLFSLVTYATYKVLNAAASFKNGQAWKPILAALFGLAAIVGALVILSLMVSNEKVFYDTLKATGLLFSIMIGYGIMLQGAGKIKNSKGVGAILAVIGSMAAIIGALYLLIPLVKTNGDLIKVAGIAAILEASLFGLIKITESFLKFGKANKLGNGKWMIKSFASLGLMIAAFAAVAAILIATSRNAEWYEILAISAGLSAAMIALTFSMSKVIKSTNKIKANDLFKATGKILVMIALIGALSAIFITLSSFGESVSLEAIAKTTIVAYALIGLLYLMGQVVRSVRNVKTKDLGKAAAIFAEFIVIFTVFGTVLSVMSMSGVDVKTALGMSQTIMLCLLEIIALATLLGQLSKIAIKSTAALPALLGMVAIFTVLGIVLGALSYIGADAKEMLKTSQVVMLCLLELSVIGGLLGAFVSFVGPAVLAIPSLILLTVVFAALALVLVILSKIGGDAKQMLKTSQIVMLCLLELSVIAALLGAFVALTGPAVLAIPSLILLTAVFAALALVLVILSKMGVDAKKMLASSQVVMLCLLELSGICALLGTISMLAISAIASEVALAGLVGIMYLLGKLMEYLTTIDFNKALPKLEQLKTFLWSMTGLMAVLGAVSMAGVAGGAALIVLSAGIAALGASLILLSTIDLNALSSGINSLIIPLGILTGFGLAGVPAGLGLLALSAGIAALGLACLVASSGVQGLSDTMSGIGKKISEATSGIKDAAGEVADGFKDKFGSITSFVDDTIAAIKAKISGSGVIGALKDAGVKMGSGLVNAFREATGWHSPPQFIVKFFEDAGVAVNRNANGLTDLFTGTGETWGSAISKALGSSFNIDGIKDQLMSLIGTSDLAGMSLDSLMAKLKNSTKSTTTQREELVKMYTEGKISGTEFNHQMQLLTEQERSAKKQTDVLSESVEDLGTSLKGTGSATKSFRETLKDTLESQMNIFQKFEKKSELSKEELLDNMRSQIEGMTNWAAQMNKLATMGIDKGLYQKLAEMGPQGAEYVDAFANMTAEEMAAANSMWAQSLVLPGDIAGQVNADWRSISRNMVNGLSAGWTDRAGVFHKNILDTSQDAQNTFKEDNGIHSPSTVYFDMGYNMMRGLRDGINAYAGLAKIQIGIVSRMTLNTAKAEFAPGRYYEIGKGIVEGLYKGIINNSGPIYSALADIATRADSLLRKLTETHSPSEVFAEIGRFWDIGLAEGVRTNAQTVYKSIENMGETAIDKMRYTVAQIATNLINDIDDPVIKPILDLSNVQAGMRTLNNVLTTNKTITASGKVNPVQNAQENTTTPTMQFTQINNSPKALSRMDIYRDTRNLFAQAKGALS